MQHFSSQLGQLLPFLKSQSPSVPYLVLQPHGGPMGALYAVPRDTGVPDLLAALNAVRVDVTRANKYAMGQEKRRSGRGRVSVGRTGLKK